MPVARHSVAGDCLPPDRRVPSNGRKSSSTPNASPEAFSDRVGEAYQLLDEVLASTKWIE